MHRRAQRKPPPCTPVLASSPPRVEASGRGFPSSTSPYLDPCKHKKNNKHGVRGHGLNIVPGGTSRDKNRKNLDNYSESTEQWNILGKLRIRPIFFGIFPTPDKVMCYRSKNHRAFFFIRITHKHTYLKNSCSYCCIETLSLMTGSTIP